MLKVHAEKLGDVTVLHCQGRIVKVDATTTLREAVLAQAGASAVVLDLGRVNGIDAGGLGVLLEVREWTQSKGIEFRFTNVTRLVKKVLEITRLDSVFEISAPESAGPAIAGVRPSAIMKTSAEVCFES